MKRTRAPNYQPTEGDVTPQIVQALQASGVHAFRNNIGVAKFGQHWVRYGVGGNGGADHIGYLPVRVTQEMVGQLVAVFVAVEAKRPTGGVYTDAQIDFLKNVSAAGGIAGFAKSWEEARGIVTKFFTRFVPVHKPVRKKRIELS